MATTATTATTTASRRREPVPDHGPAACICARAEVLRTCDCGQALDACRTPSCPRCGARVSAGAAVRRPPCPAGWKP
jgi:hypothetical protein